MRQRDIKRSQVKWIFATEDEHNIHDVGEDVKKSRYFYITCLLSCAYANLFVSTADLKRRLCVSASESEEVVVQAAVPALFVSRRHAF